jgi:predicted pyridoxine 5'-phosphate oxidase superfamily flavin-nucleotide-binding protein
MATGYDVPCGAWACYFADAVYPRTEADHMPTQAWDMAPEWQCHPPRLNHVEEARPTEHHDHPGSTGEHTLQGRYATKDRAQNFYERQMLSRLNRPMRDFVARQEMFFIATSDSKGNCDCSFRAGLPGFVRVVNELTLAYPEYRGNGVLASLGNIHENPKVGMIFVDFYRDTVGLHVNGNARIIESAELILLPGLPDDVRRDVSVTGGRKPERWVLVEVEEAYIHCSKHIPLLTKLDKSIAWGTDDARLKGGNYFGIGRSESE